MAFQKEAPVYLQVRRSNLQNIGINITNPYDYTQVVPFVSCFINVTSDQYFKVSVEETANSYNYTNPDCNNQIVKIYYKIDEVTVSGAAPYEPMLHSSPTTLLAGSQQFVGLEQEFGCYPVGSAPTDPTNYTMVFEPFSQEDPTDPTKYIVYDLMSADDPKPYIVVDSAPGYDAISFVADDPTALPATATGTFVFRVYPLVEIQMKP